MATRQIQVDNSHLSLLDIVLQEVGERVHLTRHRYNLSNSRPIASHEQSLSNHGKNFSTLFDCKVESVEIISSVPSVGLLSMQQYANHVVELNNSTQTSHCRHEISYPSKLCQEVRQTMEPSILFEQRYPCTTIPSKHPTG